MQEAPKNHHMINRDGVWYFRRRVPKDLVPVFGKTFIQFSLQTNGRKEAEKLRNLADVKWDARFKQAEEQVASGETPASVLSRQEALKVVRDYVVQKDIEFQNIEAKRGLISQEAQRDIEIELGITEQELADPSSEQGCIHVSASGS